MNATSSFTNQLEQLGEAQLSGISTHDILTSTVHLILTTVFFTGAAISLAKQSDTPKKIYLATLCAFLEKRFGLDHQKAAGMIESNARLCKRYILIEKIYSEGWAAAHNWSQQAGGENDELKTLLKKYHNLSMSDLSIDGTKEQKPEGPEIESIAPVTAEPVIAAPPSRLRQAILLLIVLVLLGSAVYFALVTDSFPALDTFLGSLLK